VPVSARIDFQGLVCARVGKLNARRPIRVDIRSFFRGDRRPITIGLIYKAQDESSVCCQITSVCAVIQDLAAF
jgi:hypothetical protein